MSNKKAIILLHGFRQKNSDDFAKAMEYFNSIEDTDIINEPWFDNYDLDTQTIWAVKAKAVYFANLLSGYSEVKIIGYSTGALLAKQIKNNLDLDKTKVYIYLVGPLIKRYVLNRAIGAWKEDKASKKAMKDLTDQEKQDLIKNNETNIHYFNNFRMTEKMKLKFRKGLIKDSSIHWYLATNDMAIRTPEVYRILMAKGRKVTVEDFNHGLIFNYQLDMFIKWFESRVEEEDIIAHSRRLDSLSKREKFKRWREMRRC